MFKQKISSPTYFYTLAILAGLFHYIIPVVQLIDFPYRYIGILLMILGLGLILWANHYFHEKSTPVRNYEMPVTLITDGPFKYTRNPIYLGNVLILLGESILFGSLITFLAPVLFFVLVNIFFIPMEEKILEKQFGKEYLEYKKKVEKW